MNDILYMEDVISYKQAQWNYMEMLSMKFMLLYKFTHMVELYSYNVNLIVCVIVNNVNLTRHRIT